MVYEECDLSYFNINYLGAKCFVVHSLNVATNAILGFIPFFNPMSRHKAIMSRHMFCNQLKARLIFCCDRARMS